MENKLSMTEIRFIRSLAGKKTDEELATMINKPVSLIQMQFALMSNLPKRPWERGPVIKAPKLPKPPKVEKIRSKPAKPVKEKPVKTKPVKKEKLVKKPRTKAGSQRDKQAKKAVKKRVVVQVNEAVVNRQKEWKNKYERTQHKTKQVDLTGKVAYRLNAKTVVFDVPGADIDELKRKYRIA